MVPGDYRPAPAFCGCAEGDIGMDRYGKTDEFQAGKVTEAVAVEGAVLRGDAPGIEKCVDPLCLGCGVARSAGEPAGCVSVGRKLQLRGDGCVGGEVPGQGGK